MDEKLYWIGLNAVPNLVGNKLYRLVERFGSARGLWEAGENELKDCLELTPSAIKGFLKTRSKFDPVKEINNARQIDTQIIVHYDEEYPDNLKKIFDPPPVLYVKGELKKEDNIAIGVVGARKATPYGRAVAEKLAGDLAGAGITIVSGMARGIDTSSHIGSLKAGGRTIAVLGCGLDLVYPRENKNLMRDIINHGAVISEFPFGTEPLKMNFPRRNRIISGLSLGVVIVEAAESSGSLITADYALEQGRDVFAVPGQVDSVYSRGPHKLIKQGAKLVENASDIYEELGLFSIFSEKDFYPTKNKLSTAEKKVYDLLSLNPVQLEELIAKTGMPPGEVITTLMFLEINGLIKQLPGQSFVLASI